MDLYKGIVIVCIFFCVGLGFVMAMVSNCLGELLANMPLNEWATFDEVVRHGKSTRWITRMCLRILVKRKAIAVRPSTKAVTEMVERMKKMVEATLEALSPEQKKRGVLIGFETRFKDLRELEFMLLVRPNAPREVEEKK